MFAACFGPRRQRRRDVPPGRDPSTPRLLQVAPAPGSAPARPHSGKGAPVVVVATRPGSGSGGGGSRRTSVQSSSSPQSVVSAPNAATPDLWGLQTSDEPPTVPELPPVRKEAPSALKLPESTLSAEGGELAVVLPDSPSGESEGESDILVQEPSRSAPSSPTGQRQAQQGFGGNIYGEQGSVRERRSSASGALQGTSNLRRSKSLDDDDLDKAAPKKPRVVHVGRFGERRESNAGKHSVLQKSAAYNRFRRNSVQQAPLSPEEQKEAARQELLRQQADLNEKLRKRRERRKQLREARKAEGKVESDSEAD